MAFFGYRSSRQSARPMGACAKAESEGASESAGSPSPELEAALRTRIVAQPSATNPNECRFMVDATIHEGRLIRVPDSSAAKDSPLARRLMEIPEVVSLHFVGNVVTVTKEGNEPWQDVAKKIGTAIRQHLASGQAAVTREPEEATSNEELYERVQQVIDSLINPGVAGHGGYVKLLGVDKNTAYVQLGGGCHGCGMADYTLKQGVAQAIQRHVPEIAQVLDATDHSTGENPFYAPRV